MSPPDGVGPKETTASGPSEDSGTSVFAVAEDDEELCNLSVSGLSVGDFALSLGISDFASSACTPRAP